MFRRRSSDASGLLDQDQAAAGTTDDEQARPARPGLTPPKGAPTPKRSEAQANRRQPYQAPTDRKAAAQQSKQRGREDRLRRTQALQRGEQWALPRKDQGPVRALARDVVDSRRGVGEYYMIMVVVLIVLLVLPGQSTKIIADAVVLALLVLLIIAEGWLVGRQGQAAGRRALPRPEHAGRHDVHGHARHQHAPDAGAQARVNRGDKV